jgi:hypothetical protein
LEGDEKMAKDSTDLLAKVGSWAFILGVIIAVIVGVFGGVTGKDWVVGALLVLGLVVGFLNVTGRETTPFLLAAVSLVIVSGLGGDMFNASLTSAGMVGTYLKDILSSLMVFVIPATIVVALKAIYALAHDE